MIEGLKVTVSGEELSQLCTRWAEHHHERAKIYADQIKSMEEAKIESAVNMTNGDPIAALKSQEERHVAEASEMEFIAKHLVRTESYLLDNSDLARIGVTKRRW